MSNETFSITIPTKAIAELFVEMVQKTAVSGPNAKNLAALYERAESVALRFGINLPPTP